MKQKKTQTQTGQTIECGLTVKRIRDIERTYSQRCIARELNYKTKHYFWKS